MDLAERIETARRLLRDGRIINESSVSTSIVFPILQALGWDVFDPGVVAPEYRVETRRVDFALLHHGKPVVFVEVKQPGQDLGADRQLFEYAFHVGVPLAVLTDGRTWSVYLPSGAGDYRERRVYLLDLEERDPRESAERLMRYLGRADVISEEAFRRAQVDYQRSRQRREAREVLPTAWAALLEGRDQRIVDALADEVESRSGYRPDSDDILEFLTGLGGAAPPVPRPRQRSAPGASVREARAEEPSKASDNAVGFWLDAKFTPARNGRDVLIKLFQALGDRDPTFLDRFIALEKHGQSRRYLARSIADLYPKDPDFGNQGGNAVQVRPGYWLMLHASHKMLESIARKAAETAGLRMNHDLRLTLKQ